MRVATVLPLMLPTAAAANFPRETSVVGFVEEATTKIVSSMVSNLAPQVTEPPVLRVATSSDQYYFRIGWTAEGDDNSTITWQPMTYDRYTWYYTSDRFFDSCRRYDDLHKTGYPDDFPTYCSPTYTACAGGWIEGPSIVSRCEHVHATMTFQCITDLMYASYGAQSPLSRIKCQAGAAGTTIYLISPTVAWLPASVTATATRKARYDLYDSPPNYTAIALGSVLGFATLVLSIALGMLVIKRRRAGQKRKALRAGSADYHDESLRVTASNVVQERDDMSLYSAAPPSYKP